MSFAALYAIATRGSNIGALLPANTSRSPTVASRRSASWRECSRYAVATRKRELVASSGNVGTVSKQFDTAYAPVSLSNDAPAVVCPCLPSHEKLVDAAVCTKRFASRTASLELDSQS